MRYYKLDNEMIYYQLIKEVRQPYISKNRVQVERDKLEFIRKLIISNCGIVRHVKCKNSTPNPTLNKENILNLTHEEIKPNKEYILDYDEITSPYEAELISKILSFDNDALDELLDIIYSSNASSKTLYQEKIDELNHKVTMNLESINLGSIPINKGCKEVTRITNELNELKKYAHLNENKKPVGFYYQMLKESFTFEPISYMTLESLDELVYFFDEENIDHKIAKIRIKTKKTDK